MLKPYFTNSMQNNADEKAVFRHGYAYQYFPYNGERLDFKGILLTTFSQPNCF